MKGLRNINGKNCIYVGEAEYICDFCAMEAAGCFDEELGTGAFDNTGLADIYKTMDGDVFADTGYVMLDSEHDVFRYKILPKCWPAKRGRHSTSHNKIRARLARPFVKTDDDDLPF